MKIVIMLSMVLLFASSSFAVVTPAYNVRAVGDLKVDGTLYLKDGTPIVSSDGLLKIRGTFVLGTSYFAGDVVQSGGSSYVCKVSNQGQQLTNDGTYWSVMATQGAKGDTGATGPAGTCNLDTLCNAIIAANREVPAFCTPSTQVSIIGVWRTSNGAAFTYLALFSDNTFLFADSDPTGTSGVEVGTYINNGTNITFNVVFDRNGTGSDSGIGDIGTPSVIGSVLSNNNNTLTIAGGNRVLTRATFNTAPIVNVWRKTNGPAFSYLILFADNTFMYAEKSSSVVPATENGLEAGTYTYGGGNLTFNISYDDNGPGQNSGVGNIGTPSVISAVISPDGNSLTVAGAIVLTKVF